MVTNVKVNMGNELNEVKLLNTNLSVKLTDLLSSLIGNGEDYDINTFKVNKFATYIQYEYNISKLFNIHVEDSAGIITRYTLRIDLDGALELCNYFVAKPNTNIPYGRVSSSQLMYAGGRIRITHYNGEVRDVIYNNIINSTVEDTMGKLIRSIVADIVLTKYSVEQPYLPEVKLEQKDE